VKKNGLPGTVIAVNGQEWIGLDKIGGTDYWYDCLNNENEEELQSGIFVVKADPAK
jgi:hypothetical protein